MRTLRPTRIACRASRALIVVAACAAQVSCETETSQRDDVRVDEVRVDERRVDDVRVDEPVHKPEKSWWEW